MDAGSRTEGNDQSDGQLISAIAAGEHDALGELYDRLGPVAYSVALRVAGDEELAADAVQEAFLSVWRRARSFDAGNAAARTWVLMLVHTSAVELVRRNDRTELAPTAPSRRRLPTLRIHTQSRSA